jgi:hypothetical protein
MKQTPKIRPERRRASKQTEARIDFDSTTEIIYTKWNLRNIHDGLNR